MKQLIPINNCYFTIRLYLDHILRYESKIAELLRSPEFPNIPDTYVKKDLEIHAIEIV